MLQRGLEAAESFPSRNWIWNTRVGPGLSERAWAVNRLLVARRKLFFIPQASIGTEDRGLGSKTEVSFLSREMGSTSVYLAYCVDTRECTQGMPLLSKSLCLGITAEWPTRLPGTPVNTHVPSPRTGRGFDGKAACSSPRPQQAWLNFLYVCFQSAPENSLLTVLSGMMLPFGKKWDCPPFSPRMAFTESSMAE